MIDHKCKWSVFANWIEWISGVLYFTLAIVSDDWLTTQVTVEGLPCCNEFWSDDADDDEDDDENDDGEDDDDDGYYSDHYYLDIGDWDKK